LLLTELCDRPVRESGPSASEVLDRLSAAGIRYCVLRPSANLDSAADIDLLVEESSRDRCETRLEEEGFVAGPGRSPFKLVMLRYQDGQLLCLDIHWKAVQYGLIYMDSRRMLDRRIERDGVFHLSAEDELIHLVVHNFLRKGRLRSDSLAAIRRLVSMPLDRQYLDEHLNAFGLKASFDAATAWIARNEPNLAKADALRTHLFRAVLRARAGNPVRHLLLRTGVMPASRVRGGMVALIGPDGCGKSTIVKTLLQRSRAIPNLKIETTYLGPWGQMKLTLVPALRRFGITPSVQAPGASPESGRARVGSAAKGYLFYAALYIELLYRYVTSVLFRVRKGRWVLADRYITDLRYLYKERPIANYECVRRLLCRFFPKPDLLIVLDNRAEVIVARKPQLAVGQIETLRHFALKAAQTYRFEVVTTDRSPEEVADYVLNRMLSLRAVK